jgi:beta-galactosidase
MLTSEVREHNNAPALFIDGKPDLGLMFWHGLPSKAADEIAGFARAGVNLITTWVPGGPTEDEKGIDTDAADAAMKAVLAANPSALVMPRMGVEPGEWWFKRYPEELMRHRDAATGEAGAGRNVSFSSRRWREQFTRSMAAMIRHLESRWGDKVLGYHLGGGFATEWAYSWDQVLSDYSAPQRDAFRAWLRARYGNDTGRLREAWNDPKADFDAAEVPTDRTRAPEDMSILDPARERRIIDYLVFHSEVAADAAILFCAAAKEALAAAGRKKICGAFYGYHFWNVGRPAWYHNSGHHAMDRVLASPHVDFISVPIFYQDRYPGGSYLCQAAAGSIRAHGKLMYSEDDTRSWIVDPKEAPWVHQCPDLKTTVDTLRRNLIGALADGGTQWWMDMMSGGWYKDAALLAEIAPLRRIAEAHFVGDRGSAAEIAVIVSKESAAYLRYDAALTDALLGRQMSELAHAGAPFDAFLASDLERVFKRPESRAYRLVIFADAFFLTPDQRRAVRELVARDGRTCLWVHGAGMVTDKGLSIEAAAELTGICIGQGAPMDKVYCIEVETGLTGARMMYGVGAPVGPILWGDDPKAEVWGWLSHPHHPGLLHRDFGGWRSIWSAAPALPCALLTEIARRAGVHVYSESGDQVFRTKRLLAVHAFQDGPRRIRLPEVSDVRDVLTEKPVALSAKEFDIDMRRGETGIWRVERK